jgi:uncharacterized membrane protein
MAGLLTNLRNTIILSLVLAVITAFAFGSISSGGFDRDFLQGCLRAAEAVSRILWIGLLYYFNLVQIRVMPQIPTEQKQVINRYIAPEALLWFRWAALATMVFSFGAMLARAGTYTAEVLSFGWFRGFNDGDQAFILMSVGVWLAVIMFLMVWLIIWPNQKRALNLGMGAVELDDDTRTKAGHVAMLASRTCLLLSLPMLTALAMYQILFV